MNATDDSSRAPGMIRLDPFIIAAIIVADYYLSKGMSLEHFTIFSTLQQGLNVWSLPMKVKVP